MDFVRYLLICSIIFNHFVTSLFGYDLTIVHNNDVHAHFEQINKYSGECSDEQATRAECFGGEARRITIIKEARANFSNTLVLDAGDRFTGKMFLIIQDWAFKYDNRILCTTQSAFLFSICAQPRACIHMICL